MPGCYFILTILKFIFHDGEEALHTVTPTCSKHFLI
jgi:hypothetical protein